MEKIQCVIDSITFRDEKNGYTVVRVSSSNDSFTAEGIMPAVHVGSVFNLYGSWKVHPRFGYEFAFQECEETLPATVEGLCLVGERKAVYIAVMNNKIVERNTRLGERLRDIYN